MLEDPGITTVDCPVGWGIGLFGGCDDVEEEDGDRDRDFDLDGDWERDRDWERVQERSTAGFRT